MVLGRGDQGLVTPGPLSPRILPPSQENYLSQGSRLSLNRIFFQPSLGLLLIRPAQRSPGKDLFQEASGIRRPIIPLENFLEFPGLVFGLPVVQEFINGRQH